MLLNCGFRPWEYSKDIHTIPTRPLSHELCRLIYQTLKDIEYLTRSNPRRPDHNLMRLKLLLHWLLPPPSNWICLLVIFFYSLCFVQVVPLLNSVAIRRWPPLCPSKLTTLPFLLSLFPFHRDPLLLQIRPPTWGPRILTTPPLYLLHHQVLMQAWLPSLSSRYPIMG